MLSAAVCGACGFASPCTTPLSPVSCADLTLEHRAFNEWHVVHPRGILQEVDDAFYPACHQTAPCGADPLSGMGATDVWRYDGVDPTKAVIGLREDTDTYVVFVRVGVDPATLGK